MSELFSAPYLASNRKTLQVALRNRKLADQLIKQIYDLQVYGDSTGMTITKWVIDSPIVPSSSSPYVIDSVKIAKQLTRVLANRNIAARMLNVIRELQLIAGISPIIGEYAEIKSAPFKASLLRALISSLANKKLGKLLQEALYELQVEFALVDTVSQPMFV